MARPQSQAIAGYYPTPQHLLPAIASTIAVPKDEPRSRFLFLDPCAGTGEALLKLAAAVLDYDLEDAARSCLGIELETERAKALRDRLPQGSAHHGDALTFGFAGDGATVLFLNPPYDTDPDYRRSEHRFLVRFTETLAPGGILVFVVPCATLSACADHLAAHYTHLHLWRFPDPDFVAFRQCVLVGLRREAPVPPDAGLLDLLRRGASDPSTMPILASLPHPALREAPQRPGTRAALRAGAPPRRARLGALRIRRGAPCRLEPALRRRLRAQLLSSCTRRRRAAPRGRPPDHARLAGARVRGLRPLSVSREARSAPAKKLPSSPAQVFSSAGPRLDNGRLSRAAPDSPIE